MGYIISFQTFEEYRAPIFTLMKIAGTVHDIFTSTSNKVTTHVYAVPSGKLKRQELTAQLQAVPDFQNVIVVEISKPIKGKELFKVREISAVNYDASKASDHDLSLYLNAKLDGQFSYYIHSLRSRNKEGQTHIQIKRIEDHPEYATILKNELEAKETHSGGEDEIIIDEEVMLEEMERSIREAPPRPPLPENVMQMTDEEIRAMIKKNDPREIKDESIKITRSRKDISITIKFKWHTEAIGCSW
ncbi:MAG TPA: hypothetical protein VF622_15625 [Segetibacter sp.]|jgi:hypothetical protein